MDSKINNEHTRECDKAARYFAAVCRGACDGDEDDRRNLPAAQRALNRAREACGCQSEDPASE